MKFELWKLGIFLNILFLFYGIYRILFSSETDTINFFGKKNPYSVHLIIFYISIIFLSIYSILFDDKFIARSLFLMLIIYKLILFTLFDIYTTDIIKIINLIIIIFLGISLYIGFLKKNWSLNFGN